MILTSCGSITSANRSAAASLMTLASMYEYIPLVVDDDGSKYLNTKSIDFVQIFHSVNHTYFFCINLLNAASLNVVCWYAQYMYSIHEAVLS